MVNLTDTIVIGFLGKLGSGKTEAANAVAYHLGGQDTTVRLSFGEYLKNVVWYSFGLEPKTKDMKFFQEAPYVYKAEVVASSCRRLDKILVANNLDPLLFDEELAIKNFLASDDITIAVAHRKLLQFVGTDIFRERDEMFWVRAISPKCIEALANGKHVVIDDVRFMSEGSFVIGIGGKLIKVVSDRQKAVSGLANHKSETELDKIGYHTKLENKMRGLDALSDDVKDMLVSLFS